MVQKQVKTEVFFYFKKQKKIIFFMTRKLLDCNYYIYYDIG